MWEIRTQAISSGVRIELFLNGTPLTYHEFFSLLENDADFAAWYTETLAGCNFEAFFWELPPLTADKLGNGVEFVIIESALLAGFRPDPLPFESQFELQQGSDVISFPNLGGDALLIVPTPIGSVESYTHLAAFLRTAPGDQVRLLWKVTAQTLSENLRRTPRWLSTAGLGVSWLHLRIDTHPKYYNFSPYKTADC